MTTMTHQWLATYFIPHSVIDEVMSDANKQQEIQQELKSSWDKKEIENTIRDDILIDKNETANTNIEIVNNDIEENKEEEFFKKYWEVDKDSLNAYMKNNPDLDYDNLLIENPK